MPPVLEVQGVSKFYRRGRDVVWALKDVSVTIDAGEFVAVRGPSGCGKTTLLMAAGGLLACDEGKVLLGGQDLYAMGHERRARLRAASVGFVFQQFHLIPYLSVLDNVLTASLAVDVPDARARAEAMLAEFHLADRMSHLPDELSTGERQRVAMARALLTRPALVLADEPTGNLDEENARVAMECLASYAAGGAAVMTVTHDSRMAGVTQRTINLQRGMLVGQDAKLQAQADGDKSNERMTR